MSSRTPSSTDCAWNSALYFFTLVREESGILYQPWQRIESEWPVTVWPAFEAVKCAERQSLALADDLDWAIRVAFFAERRCISLRHILLALAHQVGTSLLLVDMLVDKAVALPRNLGYTLWETISSKGTCTQRHASSGQALSSLLISPRVLVFLSVTVAVFMHLNRRERSG